MDWDGDGRLDIIVGDREGFVHYFRRLEEGVVLLEEQDPVPVGGRPIDVGYNSAPVVADWNGDGLPDLVVGSLSPVPAGVFLFINQGEPNLPEYLQTDTVFCMGEPVQLTAAYPDMHDLTGDGLPELLVGSANGNVLCCVNTGTPEQPLFQYAENLRADGEEIYFCSYVRPSVCNWNDDGMPDLLLADDSGMIHLFTGTPPEGIREQVFPEVRLLRNPAGSAISIGLELPEASEVSVAMFSLDGRLVGSRDEGVLPGGATEIQLNFEGVPPGIYILEVVTAFGPRVLRAAVIP